MREWKECVYEIGDEKNLTRDRKCVTIIILLTSVVILLGDIGSYGVILSIICAVVPIYLNLDKILPYNSYSCRTQNFPFWKKYLYVGKNVDSYLLLHNACMKFSFIVFVYSATSSLFVACGEMSFRMAFNLAFGVYTVGLLGSTLAKIRRSNPKFQDTLIGFCIALMVVYGCLISFFYVFVDFGDKVSIITKLGGLGFLSVAVFCIPMFAYTKKVNNRIKYKILLYDDVKNVKSFRIVTEGGRSYELGKELLYPVQQNSGDYFLFLTDGNFAVVPEKEAKIEYGKK